MFTWRKYFNKLNEENEIEPSNTKELCMFHIYKEMKELSGVKDVSVNKFGSSIMSPDGRKTININLTFTNRDEFIDELSKKLSEMNMYDYEIKNIDDADGNARVSIEFTKKFASKLPIMQPPVEIPGSVVRTFNMMGSDEE